MKKSKYLRFIVLIVPLFFLWLGFNVELAKFGNDPNYVYLVNATALCDGHGVGYIDHPGTTVMQIGAVTIAVTHLFNNPENETLVTHVFRDSHLFIFSIRNVLMVLNAIVLLLLGLVAIKKTHSVWVALLLQGSTLITANTLDHAFTKVAPEPFLFFLTTVFVMAILWFYVDKNKNPWKFVIAFSLLIGAGLATKATFLPMAIFPFIVLPTIKKKLVYSVGIIPSFVLFTIPIIPEYDQMYYWFRRLISHTGKYGHGEKELIDLKTYLPNILRILENNPIFGIVTGVGILMVIYYFIQNFVNKKKIDWDIKILTGLIASSVFGILLVAKQYNGNHYLIPVLLLTGISLFFILNVLLRLKFSSVIKTLMLPVIVVVLFVFIGWKQTSEMNYVNYGYRITNEEMDSTNAMLASDYAEYTRIYYYPFSLNKYSALNFGDVYSNRKMLPQLKELYPNIYFYNFDLNLMQYWNAEIFLEDLIEFNGNKILMVGGPRDENLLEKMEKRGLPFKKVYKGRIQAIYELDTLKYSRIAKHKVIEKQVTCNMEMLNADNQLFLGTNNKLFGNANSRTSEIARSGKYAIKMDEKIEFALEYILDSVKSGEMYEIEVWRKSDNYSGRLVVGATKANIFYKAQNDFIISEKNGWNLIRIKFTVTPEMNDETLKIHLWNKDKELVYFDDMTIKKYSYKKPETVNLTAIE